MRIAKSVNDTIEDGVRDMIRLRTERIGFGECLTAVFTAITAAMPVDDGRIAEYIEMAIRTVSIVTD